MNNKKHIRFIINPISGVGQKGIIPPLIENHLDKDMFTYDIAFTEYKGHGSEIAREASKNNVDIVCAVGGDGSVHDVGTALIGTETKLAIIPVGSGNGLARHLNIPLNIKDAIECINKDSAILMDTVKVNNRSFLGIGGYGFDAVVAKKFDTYGRRGLRGYVSLIIKEFFKFNPINVSIDLDGKVKTLPVFFCTIANSSQFGNGFIVSPKSNVTDGKLELYLLKPFSVWNIPKLIYQFFMHKGDKSKFAEVISFKQAKIKLTNKIAHYDGEPIDVKKEIDVCVVPHSLNVLVGKQKV